MWVKGEVIRQLDALDLHPKEVPSDGSISWGRERAAGVEGEPRGWVHVKGEGGRWPSAFVRLIIASSREPDPIGGRRWKDVSAASRIVTTRTWQLDHVPADAADEFVEVIKRLL